MNTIYNLYSISTYFFLIVITGVEKHGVISAKTRLELIIGKARQKLQFTHFLSISISASDEIKFNFNKFKESVLKSIKIVSILKDKQGVLYKMYIQYNIILVYCVCY